MRGFYNGACRSAPIQTEYKQKTKATFLKIGRGTIFGGDFLRPEVIGIHLNRSSVRNMIIRIMSFVLIAAMAVLLTGSLYFKSNVYITDNGVTKQARTNETDVYSILSEQGYTVGEYDSVEYTADDKFGYINIIRAFDIYVTVDGETVTVPVVGGTVQEALEKAGVSLGEFDEISPAVSESVYEGMEITVTRVEYAERTVTAAVPFETEYIDNTNRQIGYENVLSEGSDGECVRTYKDMYVNGVLTVSDLVSEVVTVEASAQKIERGTACAVPYAKMDDPSALTLVDGVPENYTRIVSGKATAYSSPKVNPKTASGRDAVVGTVAVNPNVIPYGSELYIVSQDRKHVYGYAIAADTGLGMMQGTVAVDLFCASYADSCKWGAHYVDIFVISEGNG